LKQAIEYEIARQVAIVDAGGTIHQETRLFNSDTGETVGMRSKEDAHDYRYFPEPDLVPLRIGDKWREEVRATMPELPAAKRARFIEAYGLREYDAQVLTSTRAMAEYFEIVAEVSTDPKMAANWVMGDLAGLLKAANKEIADSPISARYFGELVGMIVKGELTGKMAKEVLPKIVETGNAPSVSVEREGLKQISDSGALEKIVDDVIAANPKQVEQFKAGKTTVIGFLVGQVLKASRGQANPATVNAILKSRLE
jgi:aspartyl-tRNA(Asn)/glutamyl-tRNA(Gln) amidotransferase subunit B